MQGTCTASSNKPLTLPLHYSLGHPHRSMAALVLDVEAIAA